MLDTASIDRNYDRVYTCVKVYWGRLSVTKTDIRCKAHLTKFSMHDGDSSCLMNIFSVYTLVSPAVMIPEKERRGQARFAHHDGGNLGDWWSANGNLIFDSPM
jgi:hypothetical protein